MLNQDRGRDACGFFNGLGEWRKNNEKSTTYLKDEKLREWLEDSAKTWALCGHTRGGTRGGNLQKNAHPFTYGAIIGSHNGIISNAHLKYSVDTEHAIDLLSQHDPGDYQEALKELEGWYVLTWYDHRINCVFLLNWNGDLALQHLHDTWYYSSDHSHLVTATGHGSYMPIKHGMVIRFSCSKNKVKVKRLKDFVGKARVFQSYGAGHDGGYLGNWKDRRTKSQTVCRNQDWSYPTGWLVKFPDGLWHAEQTDRGLRLVTNQAQMNERFVDRPAGSWVWMVPGMVVGAYCRITSTVQVIRTLPAGIERHPEDPKAEHFAPFQASDEDTVVLTPSQIRGLIPHEDDQERAQADAIQKAMDAEDDAVRKMAEARLKDTLDKRRTAGERFRFLTQEQGHSNEQAISEMVQEGYYTDHFGSTEEWPVQRPAYAD